MSGTKLLAPIMRNLRQGAPALPITKVGLPKENAALVLFMP